MADADTIMGLMEFYLLLLLLLLFWVKGKAVVVVINNDGEGMKLSLLSL